MKTVLPWIVAVIGLAAAAFFFNTNKSSNSQVAQLEQEVRELQPLRAQLAELKTNVVPPDELARLRKDSEDALRLRNEVRQLREARATLTQQAQSAQTAAAQAQQQAAAAAAEVSAANQRAAAAAAAAAATAAAAAAPATGVLPGGAVPATPQDALNACLNNLRQIDGAKQQWALENRKTAEAIPNRQEIATYLRSNVIPACPGGGRYNFGAVNVAPTCSIPGHVLPTHE